MQLSNPQKCFFGNGFSVQLLEIDSQQLLIAKTHCQLLITKTTL